METASIVVKQNLIGKRLDLAIVDSKLGLSRRRAKTLIDTGQVYVNGQKVRIASRSLSFGDKVELSYQKQAPKKQIALEKKHILFRKDGVLAINKPAGIATQGSGPKDKNQVLPLLKKLLIREGEENPELHLVHRLDKETTGVLLLAENPQTRDFLMDQFRSRKTKKNYEDNLSWQGPRINFRSL